MPASKPEIAEWFDRGIADNASHMLVVCDGFDYDDYPVYVAPGVDPQQAADIYNAKEMQRVLEIYDLSISKEVQLSVGRCWNTSPVRVRNDV